MVSAEKAKAADIDLNLDVDTDNYATAAAEDTPTDSDRTALSEEDFEKTRATYSAKIDTGDVSEFSLQSPLHVVFAQSNQKSDQTHRSGLWTSLRPRSHSRIKQCPWN